MYFLAAISKHETTKSGRIKTFFLLTFILSKIEKVDINGGCLKDTVLFPRAYIFWYNTE